MDNGVIESKRITLIAKWGKERITLEELDERTSIGKVKELLSERTGVLQKRQKLIGLAAKGGSKMNDTVLLGDLKVKSGKKREAENDIVHEFIMMGTKEEQIFVDPGDKEDLPDVIDDFELDFNAGSSEVRKYHCFAWTLKMRSNVTTTCRCF
jgi:ubiquitin-like domain-containing CTD phosphatase 1